METSTGISLKVSGIEKESIEEEQGQSKKRSILELPNGIVVDILSRLPIKSIYNCRCVCKVWLFSLLDTYFFQTHFARSPICLLVRPIYSKATKFHSGNHFVVDLRVSDVFDPTSMVEFNTDYNFPVRNFRVANSCNGLVYLCDNEQYYVCNPIRGDYVVLPKIKTNEPGLVVTGLGFCPKSNQYKVVRFACKFEVGPMNWDAHIYTLGMGNWRSIQITSNSLGCFPSSVYLNGSLHWIVTDRKNPEFIRCFEFENEIFQSVPPPSHFDANDKKGSPWLSLGVLGGCLYMCDDFPFEHRFHIWVMKDYGVRDSWTRDFVIQTPSREISRYEVRRMQSYQLIGLLDSGEILMLHEEALFSYSLMEGRFLDLKIDGICEGFVYNPSFVSLKDISMGPNLVVFNAKERRIYNDLMPNDNSPYVHLKLVGSVENETRGEASKMKLGAGPDNHSGFWLGIFTLCSKVNLNAQCVGLPYLSAYFDSLRIKFMYSSNLAVGAFPIPPLIHDGVLKV